MARISAKVIARIHTTSDGLAELSWEWILRVNGQVLRGSPRLVAAGNGTHGWMWPRCPRATCRPSSGITREPGQRWRASPASAGIRPAGHGDGYTLS